MKKSFALMIIFLVACSPNPTTPSIPTPITNSSQSNTTVVPTSEVVVPTAEPIQATPIVEEPDFQSAQPPVLQTLPLVNAHTNETFTLADFVGKTVLVEPMATWCPNCRRQLSSVANARRELGDENYVFVAISVGENIQSADLITYADNTGYDLIYAIATPEMMTELANTFGRAALTPPSTPHFIISPDGSMSELFTGPKSTNDLKTLLIAASGA
jgi:thiol-disulfide isomerase/thioredoxin